MGLFSALGDGDLEEAARVFALGAVRRIEGIDAGTINSNYAVDAEAGRFFLRVNEGKSEEEVAYEADLVAHLAAAGVATPSARWARLRVGLVTIFPFVEGAHRGELRPADAEAVGRSLAALHLAGRGFPRRLASRYAFERIAGRYEALDADCCDPGLMAAVTDVGLELEWLRAHRRPLPEGVIHGDLFPDNVLFDGDRLVALLDFEQAADGAFAYDLAVCLCAWCYDDDFVPARARALVAGYQAVRPLAPEERAQLYVEARFAALRFTVTRVTDVYLNAQASAAVRKAKDFRRYHARLKKLRSMEEEGFERLLGGFGGSLLPPR